MSDLNKLKELRNALACWQDDYDPTEDKEQFDMFGDAIDAVSRLEAAEKRVAELESQIAELAAQEPIAYRWEAVGNGHICYDGIKPLGVVSQSLYTRAAPPAVNLADLVPGEITRNPEIDVFDVSFMNGFNACRAEMLRRIEESGKC